MLLWSAMRIVYGIAAFLFIIFSISVDATDVFAATSDLNQNTSQDEEELAAASATALPCGNIIAPEGFNLSSMPAVLETIPIEDCDDPFGVTTDPSSPYTLLINGEAVGPSDVVAVPDGLTNDIQTIGNPHQSGVNTFLFLHDGDDYRFVDLRNQPPTVADYEAFAVEYFETEAEREFYSEILEVFLETHDIDSYLYDDDHEPLIDPWTGETIEDRFYDSLQAFEIYYINIRPSIGPGTYTMVWREYTLILVQQTFWDKLREFIIPTAHAQYSGPDPYVYTLTFTIEESTPEPTCCSSVLFLPGIQASRLYTADEKIWEPGNNGDVEMLRMDGGGNSIQAVHTNDVVDEAAGNNIYKSFLNNLDELKQEDVVADWGAFAYDWRQDVFDVVQNGTPYQAGTKYPLAELETLAENSQSGRVTLVAHSNGGLLAKAMMLELEVQGKADLVDKIVFIGTPHLGTPKAVGTLLHGYDQQKLGGLVIDDAIARDVLNSFPGVYSLLPSKRYLDLTTESIVTFSDGDSVQSLRDAYGFAITNISEYTDFLNGTEGRFNQFANVSAPYIANTTLLTDALQSHNDSLDNWMAPDGVEVHNIVGVGLQTIKAIEYREVIERAQGCDVFPGVCPPQKILRPYARFTQYGDETVTRLSAESSSTNSYFFDFLSYNRALENFFNKKAHEDFTEVAEIQKLINGIITDTETAVDYISDTSPAFTTEYIIQSIDSPVSILVTDVEGNQTGVQDGEILEEIPGSQYFEFGGTKYLIVPKDIEIITTLRGEAHGGYTLTIATLNAQDQQIIETELINATTSPTMTATYSGSGGNFGNITTDLDGDGVFEWETTLGKEVVRGVQPASYDVLRDQINDLDLSQPRKNILITFVNLSENFVDKASIHSMFNLMADQMLEQLKKTVTRYKKLKWITKQDADSLKVTIKALRANIN